MDCEQVFAILTRGPFPTGDASDSDVESHLVFCPDCQRLAAALQPVEDSFQESIAPEEGRGLPGYRGLLADFSSSPSPMTRTARFQVHAPHPQPKRFHGARRNQQSLPAVGRPLAILFFGVLLGMAISEQRQTTVQPRESMELPGSYVQSRDDAESLAKAIIAQEEMSRSTSIPMLLEGSTVAADEEVELAAETTTPNR